MGLLRCLELAWMQCLRSSLLQEGRLDVGLMLLEMARVDVSRRAVL